LGGREDSGCVGLKAELLENESVGLHLKIAGWSLACGNGFPVTIPKEFGRDFLQGGMS
jgi:hypothetical protein